jgi:hypothetical protein
MLVNWPKPTHYPDIENPEDLKLVTQLRQAVQTVAQLRQLFRHDSLVKFNDLLLN